MPGLFANLDTTKGLFSWKGSLATAEGDNKEGANKDEPKNTSSSQSSIFGGAKQSIFGNSPSLFGSNSSLFGGGSSSLFGKKL